MSRFTGLIAPNLTPFNTDLTIATDLYIEHAKWLLDGGCSAIAPFGTTGEALSVGMDERKTAIEALVDADIDPGRIIPGAGLTSVADTAELCRHAIELGCAAVMTLPPFYYKGVSDDGLFSYFSALIDAVGSEKLKIYLYHIPPVAVVPVGVELAARLNAAYPETVIGIKDSSGDWENTRRLLTEASGLDVFPGSENPLLDALKLGAPGCISATANINFDGIIATYKAAGTPEAERLQERIRVFRAPFQELGPIPAQKWLLAHRSGDARWRVVRPPLEPLNDAQGKVLLEKLDALSEPAL